MNEETLFHQALQKPTAERAAFLAQACAGDVALRRRLEILLEAHDNPDSRLAPNSPAFVPTIVQPAIVEAPGTVIGHYKLLEQIGEGGFGIVFMAEQLHPVRRKVAFKILKPGMDTRQVIARFEAERQALALMDHPHIAKVFDGGATDSGRPYFVMELVKGVPITEYCDANQLTPRERLELFVSICHAVQHAHQKGIIHRDIKPSNVLVTKHDGIPVVKVIDFGVAKALGQQLTDKTVFTNFAQMIGTPLYMSPEQAELSGLDIDTRTDIYSLGVLLYELLTGTTPFDKERLKSAAFDEIRRIIREDEPPKPSTRLSELSRVGSAHQSRGSAHSGNATGAHSPPYGSSLASIAALRKMEPRKLSQLVRGDLDWIVMKALEKDRNRRYETANGFALDIQRYLADEPVAACPPSAVYRFRKFARRNKELLTTMTALGILLVAATIGAVFAAVQSGRLAEREQELRNAAEQRADAETKARKELDKRLYANRIALAQQELFAQNTGRARELLDECPVALRGWEWNLLSRFRAGNPRTLRANDWGAVFSPDGQYLAMQSAGKNVDIVEPASGKTIRTLRGIKTWIDFYGLAFGRRSGETIVAAGDYNGQVVKLWNVDTGDEMATLECQAHEAMIVAFSPNGQRLAAGGIGIGAKVWDWRNRQVVFELPRLSICRLAYSPDGRRLAVAVYDDEQDVIIYEAATGRKIRAFGKHNGSIGGLAYSPNGRCLATCGGDATVKIWKEATGELLKTLRGHTGGVKDVVYAPDGRRLASAGSDKTIKIWDSETGQETLTLRGHTEIVMKLDFSSNGDLLVSSGLDGTKVWDATSADETSVSHALCVPGHTSFVQSVSFSPDGRFLASAGSDRLIKVWHVASLEHGMEPQALTLQADTDTDVSVAFSPDSRRLAAAGWGGSLKVWDLESGRPLLTLPLQTVIQGDDIQSIAFSPDGRHVASLGPGALAVRDATTGEKLWLGSVPAGDTYGLSYSPDGRFVAASENDSVFIWDMETAKQVRSFGHGGRVRSVAYSPDGRRLASASFDQTIRIWDVTHGQVIRTLRGHTDRVMSVAFSPDGDRLASGSADSTVRVWHAASGQELGIFRGHAGYVWSVAFSPDGRRLCSVGGHHKRGEVKIWDLTSTLDVASQPEEIERAHHQSIEFFEMLATSQPRVWQHRRNLGNAYANQNEWDMAVNEYMKAIDLNPAAGREFVDTLKERGRLAEAEKVVGQLITVHRQLSEANPKSSILTRELAELLRSAGRFPDALPLWEKLVAESPSNDDYRMRLGHTLWQLADQSASAGRHDEAEATLRRALDVFEKLAADFPENPLYRFHKGISHLKFGWQMNRPQEAEEPFRHALAIFKQLAAEYPQNQDYLIHLSYSYSGLALALQLQGKVADSTPEWDNAATGNLLANQGRWDQAAAAFSRAIELRSEDLESVWLPLALLHLKTGRTEDYRRLVSSALDRFGATEDLGVATSLGILAKLAPSSPEDVAAVLKVLERALARKPDDGLARAIRAHLLVRAGRAAEGVPAIEGMVAATPDGQGDQRFNLLFLALGRQQLGRNPEALEAYRAAESWQDRRFNAWTHRIDFDRTCDELELLLLSREKLVRLIWFPRFSPDGKWLLSAHGSWDEKERGEARLFAVEDGTEKHVLRHPRGVRTVAWSSQATFFVTGGYEGIVRFFDALTGRQLFELHAGDSVENVRLSPADDLLVTSHGSGDVCLYELPSRNKLHEFKGVHQGGIWGMAVSPSGKLVATAGQDSYVRIIDLDARKIMHEFRHPAETNGVAFTPDSRYLATGCADSLIRLFDVSTGEERAQYKGHEQGTISDLQFNSDGKLLASSGGDGTVRLWDVSSPGQATLTKTLRGHAGIVFGVAISPDDRSVASVGWDDQVEMWDVETGSVRWLWKRSHVPAVP
jgi:WD40 repeat protein/serine/threonine protein kinase/predicted Zn-dependent protease